MNAPRISIVVPAIATQGLDETLQSLRSAAYPDLEVLVEEADELAHALNRGFARATGDIRAFLPPGDALLPGALQRVAEEVAPARGRHVVMGGGVYAIEGMEGVAVEQPAEFAGLREHLQIWQRGFDVMAYASLFWHRSVQDTIGSLTVEADPAAVAYDLSCRIAKRYPIHKVDEPWSASRVAARPGERTEAEILAACIEVSRRHWGGPLSVLRWQCEASYRSHLMHTHDRARHHARQAEAARAAGDRAAFLLEYLRTWRYAPRMARERLRRRG